MAKVRTWIVTAIIAVIVIALGGWVLLVKPQQRHAADLRAQATQQEQANAALETQVRTLRAQRAALPSEQARIAAIERKIPSDPGLPAYVRFLASTAAATHVELYSVAPSAPQAAAAPSAAPSRPATAPTGASSSAPSPTPVASSAPAPGGNSQATGAAGAATQLQTISLKISIVGDYFAIQQFLAKIEKSDRATLVTDVALAPGNLPSGAGAGVVVPNASGGSGDWRTLRADISATIFMSSSLAVNGSAPAAPVPAASPSR
ncbi:MAG: hypothetical protein IRZ02_04540 [Acidothermus sp.]|nr:hypothetical protein [Acidothermus sp.]